MGLQFTITATTEAGYNLQVLKKCYDDIISPTYKALWQQWRLVGCTVQIIPDGIDQSAGGLIIADTITANSQLIGGYNLCYVWDRAQLYGDSTPLTVAQIMARAGGNITPLALRYDLDKSIVKTAIRETKLDEDVWMNTDYAPGTAPNIAAYFNPQLLTAVACNSSTTGHIKFQWVLKYEFLVRGMK